MQLYRTPVPPREQSAQPPPPHHQKNGSFWISDYFYYPIFINQRTAKVFLGILIYFFCVSFLVFGHCPAYFFTLDNHQHNFGLGYLWNSEITGNAISVSYISFNLKKVGSHPHSTLESGTFQSVLERYTVNDLINAQLPINAPYLIDTPL